MAGDRVTHTCPITASEREQVALKISLGYPPEPCSLGRCWQPKGHSGECRHCCEDSSGEYTYNFPEDCLHPTKKGDRGKFDITYCYCLGAKT